MPGDLKNPLTTVTLDKIKLCNFRIEDNPAIGQDWIELYFVLGYYAKAKDPNTFIPHANPETGEEAIYIKIEDKVHPLAPNMGLSRCDHPPCKEWYQGLQTGTCSECGIGDILPYDGLTRLKSIKGPSNVSDIQAFRRTCYNFCADEELPDPEDFNQTVYLLDAVIEYE